VSDTVFLDPAGAAQMASDLRREASALTSGGRGVAVSLPGDDAGVGGALGSLFTAEQATAAAVAVHVEALATRLERVAADAVQADRFGPR
jgi:hypothetical protein